jgi:peptide/nickel transport system substrate-binding protein
MSNKRRWTWLVGVVALAAGVSMMVAAYGIAANKTTKAPQHSQKAVGTLRAVLDTIDFLDPQQAYTAQSWWAMWNVYETLLTYKHVDGAAGYKLVPGLAQSLPTISRNGRVYKFTLRKGIRYSNGKRLKASDFKWAIKRGFLATGQGVGFYTDIAGAKAYASHPTKSGNIAGIVANNKKRTIMIKLTRPRGDFLTILALMFAAPVPGNTPPTILNGTIPGTGPYRFSAFDANRGFTLLRNKYFKKTKYIPRGTPNKIDVALVGDANAAVQRVINGQADYTNAAIPPDRIASIKSKGHLVLRQTANTYYFWMNIREAPFNKLKVRQAVNYAIDRGALLVQRGAFAGQPTSHYLPPGLPGSPKTQPYPLTPDLTAAQKLAGKSGSRKALMYTCNESPCPESAAIVQANLKNIGVDVEVKQFERAVQFSKEGTRGEPFDIAFEGWNADYADPYDFINVLLYGKSIQAANNVNFSYFDDPTYNKRMEEAATLAGDKRYSAYAKLDLDIAKNASPLAAWDNDNERDFFSARMGCQLYQPIYGMDIAALCMRA